MKKILIIILLGILAPTVVARAFSLSPLRYIFAVERGQTVEIVVTLNNYETESVTVEPAVVGIKTNDSGQPVFENDAEIISWVKPDWNVVNLREGVEKKVKFFVTIPTGIYPGDYYLGVGARRAADLANAVNIGEQLLTVVNLKVAGEAREDLVVKKFEVTAPFYDKNTTLRVVTSKVKKFNLEIENKGNVEMPVSAVLKIIDWRGRVVAEKVVNVGSKILPAATRVASTEFVIARSETTKQSLLPGRYDAYLVIDYGLTKQKITAATDFWYVPVWVIGLSAIIILTALCLWLKKYFL